MNIKYALLFVFVVFNCPNSKSQNEKPYDSVVVFQKNYARNRFAFDPPSIQKMTITQNVTRRATYPAGEILEDIGRVGLSLFLSAVWEDYSGSIGDTDEVDWVLSSYIQYPISSFTWQIQYFTKGIHYKEFYADSESVDSSSDKEVWWDENTSGILRNQTGDTISRFVILRYPDINKVIEKMAPQDFEDIKLNIMRELMSTFHQGGLFAWNIDFALIGKFRNENFAAVSSEEAGKFLIFKNGRVEAILQVPEKLHFPPTKRSEERHLLIAKGNHINQFDYLRLSMLYYYMRSNYN